MGFVCGLCILASALLMFGAATGQYTHAAMTSLSDHLLTGYNTKARPADYQNVTVGLVLTHINSLDTKNQVLNLAGGLVATWEDARLTWDTSVYNLTKYQPLRSDVWLPPLAIFNSADGRQIFSNNGDTADEIVIVSPTGAVTWPHSLSIHSTCDLNIQFYPFDEQICSIILVPWGYAKTEIDLLPWASTVDTELLAENGEWEVTKTTVYSASANGAGWTYGIVVSDIYFKRKHSYYVINILLPVILLAFLGPVVFMLPVESGEKAGFSLTILLSLSVVMTIVSDQIPTTSTNVAVLSIYLLITFIVCVIEVLVTALTIRLNNFHDLGYPVPKWLKRFMRRWLAPMVCYRRAGDKKDDAMKEKNRDSETSPKRHNKVHIDVKLTDVIDDNVYERGRSWEGEKEDEEAKEDIEYTYKEFCVMFDRINHWGFMVLTLLITMISFMTISMGGSSH